MSATMAAGHGTAVRYRGTRTRPGCRCQPCTRAHRAEAIRREQQHLAGEPPMVPLETVLPHLEELVRGGMSAAQIARATRGVSEDAVRGYLRGRSRRVRRGIVEQLLAVRPGWVDESSYVRPVGAVRRVRALYAMGHGPAAIAAASGGLHKDTVVDLVHGRYGRLVARNDVAVRRAYDVLGMQVGSSERARARAQAEGWAPPLAWDDETIDDPAAEPQWDAPVPAPAENAATRFLLGEGVVLGPADRVEVLVELGRRGEPFEEIAARLEMSPAAVERAWHRARERARKAGRPVPERPAWATAA